MPPPLPVSSSSSSSWLSRWTSQVTASLSPKAWLAHRIAQELAQFLLVDPTLVESNLLHDTKIVLSRVPVRPVVLDPNLMIGTDDDCWRLTGILKHVELSWTWGGGSNNNNNNGGFVQDTRLTLRGVQLRLDRWSNHKGEDTSHNNIAETTTATTATTTTESSSNSTATASGFVQRHVQQILDHLTLDISDVTFTVAVDNENSQLLVWQSTSLQLVSLGRLEMDSCSSSDTTTDAAIPPPPLSQRLSLASLSAVIILTNEEDEQVLPLLDPIGYAASVQRVAGRRFVDGMAKGLQVTGEVLSRSGSMDAENAKDGVVFHLGHVQLQSLQKLFVSTKEHATGGTMEHATKHDPADEDTFYECINETTAIFDSGQDAAATEPVAPPTTITLPLPSVTLVLPNDSRIHMPECTLEHCMDGSVSRLLGSRGISFGGNSVDRNQHALLEFSPAGADSQQERSQWIVDSVTSKVVVHDRGVEGTAQDSVVAILHWNVDHMRPLLQGFCQVKQSLSNTVVEQLDERLQQAYSEMVQVMDNSVAPWSLEVHGCIQARVEHGTEWVMATLQGPSVVLPAIDSAWPSLAIEGAAIGPTSFGTDKSMIRIPAMSLIPGANHVHFQGGVEADLESLQVGRDIQGFIQHVVDSVNEELSFSSQLATGATGRNHDARSNTGTATAMPTIHVPKISLRLLSEEEKAHIMITGVVIGNDGNIGDQTSAAAAAANSDTLTGPGVVVCCDKIQGFMDQGGERAYELSLTGLRSSTSASSGGVDCVTFLNLQSITRLRIKDIVDTVEGPLQDILLTVTFNHGKDPSILLQTSSKVSLCLSSSLLRPTDSDEAKTMPFAFQLSLPELTCKFAAMSSSVKVQPVQLEVKPNQAGAVFIDITGSPVIRLENHAAYNQWLEAALTGPLQAKLSSRLNLAKLKLGGGRIGPCSHGQLSLVLPPATFSSEDPLNRIMQVRGCVEFVLQSPDVAMGVKEMVERSLGLKKESATPKLPGSCSVVERINSVLGHMCASSGVEISTTIEISELKFSLTEPASAIIEASKVHVAHGSTVSVNCQALSCADAICGRSFVVKNAALQIRPAYANLAVETVATAFLPGVFDLSEPMAQSEIVFDGAAIQITLPAIHGVCALLVQHSTNKGSFYNSTSPLEEVTHNTKLPIPVDLQVEELNLRPWIDADQFVHVGQVVAGFVPIGRSLTVQTNSAIVVRIGLSTANEWIEATLLPSSGTILQDTFQPMAASSRGLVVGPSSVGHIHVILPNMEFNDNMFRLLSECKGSVESSEMMHRIKRMLEQCLCEQSSSAPSTPSPSFPYTIMIRKFGIDIVSQSAEFECEGVVFFGPDNKLTCEVLAVSEESGLAAGFSGVSVTMPSLSTFDIEINCLEALHLPEKATLESSVNATTKMLYSRSGLRADVPPLNLIVFQSERSDTRNVAASPTEDIGLPFPISCFFQQINVKSFATEGELTSISHLTVHARAQEVDPFAPRVPQRDGIKFHFVAEKIENKVMQLSQTSATGVIFGGNTDRVEGFALTTKSASVVVGFSNVDWSRIFGSQERREAKAPTLLPHARVEPFLVELESRSDIIGFEKTAVGVPLFQGAVNATTDDVTDHLVQAVMMRVPAFLTNVNIGGESLTEMSAKTAGRVLVASRTITGAAAGSVGGLVAVDSVRGALAAGKQSRGATAGDGYQFGDFTRGVSNSIRQSATSGAEVRRGSREGYEFGDFSVGATRSVGNYASQNQTRLGGAGGSGVGMVVGAAVAGPLGLVAGSFIGSKLGSSAFKTDEGDKPATTHVQQQTLHSASETDLLDSAPLHALPPTFVRPMNQMEQSSQLPIQHQQQHYSPQQVHNPAPAQMQHQKPRHQQKQHQHRSRPPEQMQTQHYPEQRTHPQHQPPPQQHYHQQQSHQQYRPPPPQQQEGYRFGDLTRGIVAKGKAKDGRDAKEGYKFGDFTRGLFK